MSINDIRVFNPGEVLKSLKSDEYMDFAELQEAVRQEFNKIAFSLPPGYTHLDVLERGLENGWIKVQPDKKCLVQVAAGSVTDRTGTNTWPVQTELSIA